MIDAVLKAHKARNKPLTIEKCGSLYVFGRNRPKYGLKYWRSIRKKKAPLHMRAANKVLKRVNRGDK